MDRGAGRADRPRRRVHHDHDGDADLDRAGSGGAVASYTVQYRVTSLGGGWTQVPSISGTGATITGLTASTQYISRSRR